MITSHTVETLQAFEKQIAEDFDAAKIRAPVHLEGGNEQQLLDIFQHVRPEDWVLTTWRSHLKCLLKGVLPELLRAEILAGRSITLCFPAYRVLSSAIVGGTLPIGIGLGMAIKRQRQMGRVWVFVGDMTQMTGVFAECIRYAAGHDLPVEFVVEDNGVSVCTDTAKVWGGDLIWHGGLPNYHKYAYKLPWPHSGAGTRVQF